jgi:hypothetical protein
MRGCTRLFAHAAIAFTVIFIVAVKPLHAQFLVRDILSSHFDPNSPGQTDPFELGRTVRDQPDVTSSRNEQIAFGTSEDSTLHTDKTGIGVIDNLNDRNSYARGEFNLGDRGSSPILTVTRSWLSGTVDSTESRTTILAGETYTDSNFGLKRDIGRGESIKLSIETPNYRFSGASSIVDSVFDIFPTNPLIYVNQSSNIDRLIWISPDVKLGQLAFSFGRQINDGSVYLQSPGSPARITIPISDSGDIASFASIVHLSSRYDLTGFGEKSALAGTGSVARENNPNIGSSVASHNYGAGGISVALHKNNNESLQAFYERSIDQWGVKGTVDSARAIGLPYSDLSGLGFNASYDIREMFTGINWVKQYSRKSSLTLGYRWIQLYGFQNYGYKASVVVIPVGNSGSQTQDDERGHLLSLQYKVPLGYAAATLHASQFIPIVDQSKSSGGSGPSGPTRSSRGGSSLGIELSYSWR